MKPKDLQARLSFERRKPYLEDRIFHVPVYYANYEEFSFPSWREIFGNEQPVEVEYCSGNGHWIVEKALQHPELNWVAVELRYDRVRKIWSKMKNNHIENLLIVCGDALTFSKHYVKERELTHIYINFPDPWPKKKHAKHRLMSDSFVMEAKRTLVEGGVLTFVSDDKVYVEEAVQRLIEWMKPRFKAPHFVHQLEGYGSSYFRELWEKKGKQIHFVEFQP